MRPPSYFPPLTWSCNCSTCHTFLQFYVDLIASCRFQANGTGSESFRPVSHFICLRDISFESLRIAPRFAGYAGYVPQIARDRSLSTRRFNWFKTKLARGTHVGNVAANRVEKLEKLLAAEEKPFASRKPTTSDTWLDMLIGWRSSHHRKKLFQFGKSVVSFNCYKKSLIISREIDEVLEENFPNDISQIVPNVNQCTLYFSSFPPTLATHFLISQLFRAFPCFQISFHTELTVLPEFSAQNMLKHLIWHFLWTSLAAGSYIKYEFVWHSKPFRAASSAAAIKYLPDTWLHILHLACNCMQLQCSKCRIWNCLPHFSFPFLSIWWWSARVESGKWSVRGSSLPRIVADCWWGWMRDSEFWLGCDGWTFGCPAIDGCVCNFIYFPLFCGPPSPSPSPSP